MGERNISDFIGAEEKQVSESTRVFVYPLDPNETNISQKHDGSVGGQHVIGAALEFLGQLQIGLAHFEKGFDIPAFSVEFNDLSFGKHGISGYDGAPFFGVIFIADEDDFSRDGKIHILMDDGHNSGSEIFGFTRTLSE